MSPLDALTDGARSAIRREAAQGARDAMLPWVALAVVLSLLALSGKRRR